MLHANVLHYRAVDGVFRSKPCSWCKLTTDHRRINNPSTGRATYVCGNPSCKERTMICRGCQVVMSKAGFVDDDYCYHCQAREIRVPRPCRRYCSWCQKITIHACVDANVSGRDDFICCGCSRPTTRCNHCVRAMATVKKTKARDMCKWCYDSNATDALGAVRRKLFQ